MEYNSGKLSLCFFSNANRDKAFVRIAPTRIVALGDANTAVRHYKQSRIGLSVVVDRHRNPVRTQS